jgi:uncharacterized membrane protein
MPTVEGSVVIQAPIDRVFAAVTDPKRAPEWTPRIIEVTDISPYPAREGTTWRQVAGMGGQTATMSCRIVRLLSPTEGILEIEGGDQEGRITTRCSQTPAGTSVAQTIEFKTPGGLKGRMMAAVAGPMLQREMNQALARLRETVERESGGESGSGSA